MMHTSLPDRPYDLRHVIAAMHDVRVQRALRIALRDAEILRSFRKRKAKERPGVILTELAEEYGLSEEHIRSIVYRKLPALRAGTG